MREILFEGKRTDNNEWIRGNLVHTQKRDFDYYEIITLDGSQSSTVKTKTVRQFTGLMDKNGKMIFEGDIITYIWNTFVGEVEGISLIAYNENEAKFVANCITNNYSLSTFEYVGQRAEVVGNRWDNPELLQEE